MRVAVKLSETMAGNLGMGQFEHLCFGIGKHHPRQVRAMGHHNAIRLHHMGDLLFWAKRLKAHRHEAQLFQMPAHLFFAAHGTGVGMIAIMGDIDPVGQPLQILRRDPGARMVAQPRQITVIGILRQKPPCQPPCPVPLPQPACGYERINGRNHAVTTHEILRHQIIGDQRATVFLRRLLRKHHLRGQIRKQLGNKGADLNMKVAQSYGMIQPGASDIAAVRATFIIDPEGVLRAMVYYPMNAGRSVDEIHRLLVALQTADENRCAMPENWKPGDEVIVPTPATPEEAQARAGEGYNTVDWYFSTRAL